MNKYDNRVSDLHAIYWALTALIVGSASAGLMAAQAPPEPFDEAEVFIELNNTDGDLGMHALIDADAWSKLVIKGPDGKHLIKTSLSGNLKKQGLTEFFFESAEPIFDDLSPVEFLARFPVGMYEIKGKLLEGGKVKSMTLFTHDIPASAVTFLNGVEDEATECDEDDADYDAQELTTPVTISWDEVTMSHPDFGGPVRPVEIHSYQLVVEIELELGGEEFESVFSVILPPDETSVTIPDAFMELADGHVKYEVLAREVSFNQTAIESCFVVDGD